MIQDYPITPPPSLVQQWVDSWHSAKVKHEELIPFVASQAAAWGADAELEGCCFWLARKLHASAKQLKLHRRPKRMSLKEQALEEVSLKEQALEEVGVYEGLGACDIDIIRHALESMPD